MIFVDTSYWVALRNRLDAHHQPAAALLSRHAGTTLLTTNHVRGEAWTYLRRKGGHRAAVAFLDVMEQSPRVSLVRVPARLESRAMKWLRRHDEREYSFVDATSFALMRSLRMQEAFAFDGDFSAAGFTELRP